MTAMVSPLVRQLSWTNNLIILSQTKRPEEREFYLRMAVRERWSKRELERQFRVAPSSAPSSARQKSHQR